YISCSVRTWRERQELWIRKVSRGFLVNPVAVPSFRWWENQRGRRSTCVSLKAIVAVILSSMTMSTEENSFVVSINLLQDLVQHWGYALRLNCQTRNWHTYLPNSDCQPVR
ncbi:hypothetical protein LINPERPRIM_LOCUS25465, partial [Linum perenne]